MSKRDSQILRLLDRIPLVKDGKGDFEAMATFSRDIRIYRLFVFRAQQAEDAKQFKSRIDEFNQFIQKRENEQWCSHARSIHKYNDLFKP